MSDNIMGKNMEILMDNREDKIMLQLLRIMNSQYDLGCKITVEFLEVCDYIIRGDDSLIGTTGIELKEADDYVSSIMDGRLFRQVMEMHVNFDRVVVIVVGSLDKIHSKMEDHSKIGALGALVTKFGTSLIHVVDREWAAYLIISILKHASTTIDMTKIFKPKATSEDRELGAISCAEGWGIKLAGEAVKHFRIRDLANIENPKIISSKIKNVGLIKAQNLINLFSGFEEETFITETDVMVFRKYLRLVLNSDNIIKKLVNKFKKLV